MAKMQGCNLENATELFGGKAALEERAKQLLSDLVNTTDPQAADARNAYCEYHHIEPLDLLNEPTGENTWCSLWNKICPVIDGWTIETLLGDAKFPTDEVKKQWQDEWNKCHKNGPFSSFETYCRLACFGEIMWKNKTGRN